MLPGIDLPNWIVGCVTIALFVGLSVAGLAWSRRWSRERGLHALVDNGVIGWVFSAIVGIYAIAIGLIAVATWGNASEASSAASHEAAAVAALFRDVGGYPQPRRGELERLVRDYTSEVIETDWPLQRLGEVPLTGARVLDDIQRSLYAYEPATIGQGVVHAEVLDSFNQVVEWRRLRLEAVEYALPGTLWGILLIGAAIAVGASFVFNMDSFQVHAVMSGLLAAMIGLLVFFIMVTDHPYHGQTGVSPEAFALALREQMSAPSGH
ncbi:MAG: DUF4239 domain-containing protein [Deltaproteobacteria bacterium]|nr:DUF4239 domain-containing protein [Deltaproteobacteria bacterium]